MQNRLILTPVILQNLFNFLHFGLNAGIVFFDQLLKIGLFAYRNFEFYSCKY